MAKIKRNDQVIVIAGKDKGKTGRVLRVILEKQRVLVEGVGMVKKHVKPNPQRNTQGGILSQEAPIHISNVMVLDSEGRATRVGYKATPRPASRVQTAARSQKRRARTKRARAKQIPIGIRRRGTPRNGIRAHFKTHPGAVEKEKSASWQHD